MKTFLLILTTTMLSFSVKCQTTSFNQFKTKQNNNLLMGSDTANYWYYKTKTYLLREPSNGYEWRMTMPIKRDKSKLIPDGTIVVKLESTQIDSTKKTNDFILLLED
ncbi:MAG: hypothetical protein ACK5B6_11405 [Bacteroidia bacterium]|jgi:hypothetical protein